MLEERLLLTLPNRHESYRFPEEIADSVTLILFPYYWVKLENINCNICFTMGAFLSWILTTSENESTKIKNSPMPFNMHMIHMNAGPWLFFFRLLFHKEHHCVTLFIMSFLNLSGGMSQFYIHLSLFMVIPAFFV